MLLMLEIVIVVSAAACARCGGNKAKCKREEERQRRAQVLCGSHGYMCVSLCAVFVWSPAMCSHARSTSA